MTISELRFFPHETILCYVRRVLKYTSGVLVGNDHQRTAVESSTYPSRAHEAVYCTREYECLICEKFAVWEIFASEFVHAYSFALLIVRVVVEIHIFMSALHAKPRCRQCFI